MEKVIRYKCEKCGKLFENEEECMQHGSRRAEQSGEHCI